jgi:hypothetical protein
MGATRLLATTSLMKTSVCQVGEQFSHGSNRESRTTHPGESESYESQCTRCDGPPVLSPVSLLLEEEEDSHGTPPDCLHQRQDGEQQRSRVRHWIGRDSLSLVSIEPDGRDVLVLNEHLQVIDPVSHSRCPSRVLLVLSVLAQGDVGSSEDVVECVVGEGE